MIVEFIWDFASASAVALEVSVACCVRVSRSVHACQGSENGRIKDRNTVRLDPTTHARNTGVSYVTKDAAAEAEGRPSRRRFLWQEGRRVGGAGVLKFCMP